MPGPIGLNGLPALNGTQSFLLTGGDLGAEINGSFDFRLSSTKTPVFYGPGNGADTIIDTEAVPIDSATASQLYVQTSGVPGNGQSYTFTLCKNSSCNTTVSCTISLPTLTQCNDSIDTVDFAPGDTITLQGTATAGANGTDVKWSVVMTQTAISE